LINPLNLYNRKYILASKSKRRIILLKQLGLDFKVFVSDVPELETEIHNPVYIVKNNAKNKAEKASLKFENEIVIAADTIVHLNGKIINKPANYLQAIDFLKRLSSKTHRVYTGVYLIDTKTGKKVCDYEKTYVKFREINKIEIEYYVKNYAPYDKAGGYGIQDDFGCVFIEKIVGDYYNVVGLPLYKLYLLLNKLV